MYLSTLPPAAQQTARALQSGVKTGALTFLVAGVVLFALISGAQRGMR